jgi:hypothetical protein
VWASGDDRSWDSCATLEQKQRWRELVLIELYDRTSGDPLNGLTPSEILEGSAGDSATHTTSGQPPRPSKAQDELGEATGREVDQQITYVEGEGLVRWKGNQIVLTHDGVRHVEERAGGGEAAAVLPAVAVRDVEASSARSSARATTSAWRRMTSEHSSRTSKVRPRRSRRRSPTAGP